MGSWGKILPRQLWRECLSVPGKTGTKKVGLFLRICLEKLSSRIGKLSLLQKEKKRKRAVSELIARIGLEETDCPACGEPRPEGQIGLENGFGLRRCSACGVWYTSPRLRKTGGKSTEFPVLPTMADEIGNPAERILLAARRLRKIRQLKQPGRILDVTGGSGEFLDLVRADGVCGCGAKISADLFLSGISRDAEVDVIALFDALPEAVDPRALLRELGNLLTEDGIIVASLPNAGCEQARQDLAAWPLLKPWKNLCHYDYAALEKLAKGCGFEIIDVDTELASGAGEVGAYVVALRQTRFEPRGKRIFLRADAARGDTLFATPVIKGLREKYPGSEISVATHFPELLGYFDNLKFVPADAPAPPEGVLRARYEFLPNLHVIEAMSRLCRSGAADRHLYYQVTPEERNRAKKILNEAAATGKKLAGIHAMAGSRIKTWGRENWQRLTELLARANFSPVTLGAAGDSFAPDGVLNLCGKLSLRESVAVLERLHLFVGLDSFLSHAAGAVRTPRVILYGSTDPERLLCDADTCPTGILRGVCEFPGCRHDCLPDQWPRNVFCRKGRPVCMESITPEMVLEKCLDVCGGAERASIPREPD